MADGVRSDMNMMEVNIERFTSFIKEQLEDDDYTPILGLGKSGIGKTECIYGLTQELGVGFCELRLVTMTETDMLGVPIIEQHGNEQRTNYASNALLPNAERDGERGILVLDEITSASSPVRAAAYQLLDSKRALGNYKLPDGWLVVALGNGQDDGGVFTGMECAFLNRCRCFRIAADTGVWRKWGINHGVNTTILAYLALEPQFIHKMDIDEVGVFPSPRSWVALSKKLNAREKRSPNGVLDDEAILLYTASCVGEEVAARFQAFYSYKKDIVSPLDIINGNTNVNIDNMGTEAVYITIQGVVKTAKEEIEREPAVASGFSERAMSICNNVCKWIAYIADSRYDYAKLLLDETYRSIDIFKRIIYSEEFDEVCPEFGAFCNKYRGMNS